MSRAAPSAPLPRGSVGFWAIILLVVATDAATKTWAASTLLPRHTPHSVIGTVVQFTLSYNPGAAFGMSVGAYSRWFFAILALIIIGVLLHTTRELVDESRIASIGLPLVIGGALGNFLDRLRYRDGVVDFIDIGVGSVRFWTFNVADTGVTLGACCLIVALWQIERARAKQTRVNS